VDIAVKKGITLKCIALGMSKERAYIYAEMSEDEVEEAKSDELYMRQLDHANVAEEFRLLKAFDNCLELTSNSGDSKDIKWKLAVINRERFGTQAPGSGGAGESQKKRFKMNIDFNKASVLLEEENVEIGGVSTGPIGSHEEEGLGDGA
jgi:hypothetical protein